LHKEQFNNKYKLNTSFASDDGRDKKSFEPQKMDFKKLQSSRPAKPLNHLRKGSIKFYNDEEGREHDSLSSDRGYETPR